MVVMALMPGYEILPSIGTARHVSCRNIKTALVGPCEWVWSTGLSLSRPDGDCLLRRLFCWREREQRDTDNYKRRYVAHQVSVFAGILECLYRHDGRVDEA